MKEGQHIAAAAFRWRHAEAELHTAAASFLQDPTAEQWRKLTDAAINFSNQHLRLALAIQNETECEVPTIKKAIQQAATDLF